MRKIGVFLLAFIFLVLVDLPVFADDVTDVDQVINETMKSAFAVAKDPEIDAAKKREKLWEIVEKIFDFEKITEFTLGKFSADSKANLGQYANRRFTQKQQGEFMNAFTRHIGNTYLDRLEFKKIDVKVDIRPAKMLKSKKGMKRAKVSSLINDKTPIDYMMLKREEQWRVYDVRVEGRSLVSAFRKEYNSILVNKKPDELIKMLKDKIVEHDAAQGKV